MKRVLKISLASLSLLALSTASGGDQPKLTLSKGGQSTWNLDWQGVAGQTYFTQWSENLVDWKFFPTVLSGDGSVISHGFSSSSDKFFTRVKWTNLPDGGDPNTADFDKDGLGSLEELLSSTQTDPLNSDTDGDQLLDGWEVRYGLLPNNADSDGDSLPDGLEDLDGDGADNTTEQTWGTDPNDPEDGGLFHLKVTGWEAQDIEVVGSKTYTITASSKSYLVLAYVYSEEYIYGYTVKQSEFDDVLRWDINPSNDDPITGSISVNSLHDQWVQSEADGTSFLGYSPIAIKPLGIVNTDPSDDISVDIEIGVTNVADGNYWSTAMINLLPVEVTVTKEGEATAPEDGLVVKKTDTVRYRLLKGVPDNPVLLEDKIQWHWRILKWDGTYEDWKPFQDGKGHTFAVSPKDSGIYEIKATVDGQDFFFKRKNDDPHSAKKKDENDCFGVVDEQWQINVRNKAKRNLGGKAYAYKVKNGNVGKNEWKCNLFVGHKADDAGADVPFVNGRFISRYYPVANQWAGIGRPAIANWTLLPRPTYPQPGWIVARGVAGGIGHVGFVGYDGAWISAGKNEVHRKCDLRNDISLRSGTSTYQPARTNKYN